MSIFSLIPVLYGIIHLYFFIELRVAFGKGLWQIPVLIWLALMALSWRIFRRQLPGLLGDIAPWVIMIWFGAAMFLLLCLVASDLARLALLCGDKLFSLPVGTLLTAKRAVTLALLLAACLSAYSLYNARNPRVTHITLHTEKLPQGTKSVRIALMTDIHLSPTIRPADLRRMLDTAAAWKPDALLIGGDLVDMDMSKRPDAELFRNFTTRYGIYAVMGNHELYRGTGNSENFMHAAGIQLLRGRAAKIGPLCVAGVDDPVFGQNGSSALPLLRSLNPSEFIILLRHRPEIEDGSAGLFDIQLSGHTHGGQIWPGYWLTRLASDYRRGLRAVDGTQGTSLVYVCDGTGYWGPPMRFLTRAEIVMLDISPPDEER